MVAVHFIEWLEEGELFRGRYSYFDKSSTETQKEEQAGLSAGRHVPVSALLCQIFSARRRTHSCFPL
jgi:hypothetical protein